LIAGRHLTGDQVSDDQILVRAKLQGLLVPALPEHVEDLRVGYKQVREIVTEDPVPQPAAAIVTSKHLLQH